MAEPRAVLKISHNRKSGLPLSAAAFVLLVMWAELAPSVLLTVLSISVFSVWAYFLSETYESNVLQVVNSTDVCGKHLIVINVMKFQAELRIEIVGNSV